MRQTEWRSERLGSGTHLLHPRGEQRPAVVGARARLGVELRRAGPMPGQVERLDGAVVERDGSDLAALARLDGEAVVLARDQHPPAGSVEDRVVRAAVPERELEGPEPGRERDELVP